MRRSWVAMALTPVGLLLTIVVALAFGGEGGDADPIAGAALALIAFAAPTAAVYFGFDAIRAKQPSGRPTTFAAVVVLVVALLAVPLLVVSTPATLLAVAVYAAVIIGSRRFARRR